jgi:hypothetical protein
MEINMDWTQTLTIIGVMITVIIWMVNKLDADVKGIRSDVKSLSNRLDGHAMRIDQLYHMFLDLLKEIK